MAKSDCRRGSGLAYQIGAVLVLFPYSFNLLEARLMVLQV